jgi:hypothetical protein
MRTVRVNEVLKKCREKDCHRPGTSSKQAPDDLQGSSNANDSSLARTEFTNRRDWATRARRGIPLVLGSASSSISTGVPPWNYPIEHNPRIVRISRMVYSSSALVCPRNSA